MQLVQKLDFFHNLKKELENEARKNGGMVKRQDLWRIAYCTNPYLARLSAGELFQRVCDVVHNQLELDKQGRISANPAMYNDNWMLQKWAHVMEEVGVRGGFSGDVISASTEPLEKYFEQGKPDGLQLLADAIPADKMTLVKYSKREYIERMYRDGEIRIAPASIYADGSLLSAQQDLEVQRQFMIPTAESFTKGYLHMNVEGKVYNISDGDIQISEDLQNYYLYSMCREIDYRLPIDFNADAALVINDAKKFQRLFFDAVRDKLKGWDMRNGVVSYYDPYTDYKRHRVLEMTKHFRFNYQKEFRLLARPKKEQKLTLEPFFIRIGSLKDISTPYFMPE